MAGKGGAQLCMVLHPMLHPALLPAHPLRPGREHLGSVRVGSLLS